MKLLLIVLLLTALAWADTDLEKAVKACKCRGLGLIVNMKINALRKKLIAGNPEQGIPSLDPLVLNSTRTQLNLDGIDIDVTNTGSISGLLGFVVEELIMLGTPCPTGAPEGCITLEYKIVFPEINIDISEYNLDAYFMKLHLFGNGKLMLNIKNLILHGKDGVVKNDNLKFSLAKMDIQISLGTLKFDLTGWANDEVRSKMLTEMINDNVPEMLQEFQPQISETLNGLIMTLTDGQFIQI